MSLCVTYVFVSIYRAPSRYLSLLKYLSFYDGRTRTGRLASNSVTMFKWNFSSRERIIGALKYDAEQVPRIRSFRLVS